MELMTHWCQHTLVHNNCYSYNYHIWILWKCWSIPFYNEPWHHLLLQAISNIIIIVQILTVLIATSRGNSIYFTWLWWLSWHNCPAKDVLNYMYCHSCLVLAVLTRLFSPGIHFLTILSLLSYYCTLSCLFCHHYLHVILVMALAVLS
jgi:hypothetical protein